MSGGGVPPEGEWRAVRTGFLLPVAVVRALFRGKVLGEIERLWLTGQLQTPALGLDDGVRQVLIEAAQPKWNIRIAERYPHGRGVMKYLARYVRGGPIKDHRFVGFDGGTVTFWYGTHQEREGGEKPKRQEMTLTVNEFLRRWGEHVPLPGVHTVRAWGLYASTQRRKLEACRAQLPEEETGEAAPQRQAELPAHTRPWEQCPVCRQKMLVIQVLPRAGAPPGDVWLAAA